jgi:hypothetical protein
MNSKFWGWAGKAGLILLPALITSYFSYLSAKHESDAKASAGYEALVNEVKRLQEAAEKSTLGVARLEGRLEAYEKPVRLSGGSGSIGLGSVGTLGHGSGSGSGAGVLKPLDRTKLMKPEDLFQKSNLPANLDQAYEQTKK